MTHTNSTSTFKDLTNLRKQSTVVFEDFLATLTDNEFGLYTASLDILNSLDESSQYIACCLFENFDEALSKLHSLDSKSKKTLQQFDALYKKWLASHHQCNSIETVVESSSLKYQ